MKAILEFMGCKVSSAFDGISGVARALEAGFDPHAVKPVDAETVPRLIAESRAGVDRT